MSLSNLGRHQARGSEGPLLPPPTPPSPGEPGSWGRAQLRSTSGAHAQGSRYGIGAQAPLEVQTHRGAATPTLSPRTHPQPELHGDIHSFSLCSALHSHVNLD